jgi:1-deoxy-D-xylulose-5-phosphate synthase
MSTLLNPTQSFVEANFSLDDIKRMSPAQLSALASRIRAEVIESVLRTGGHLASNLGIVEITLALHNVFDSPKDKLVWDVGHQIYIHKMLTGRRERFNTLRQYKGLSGFVTPVESEHDSFIAGHSSTSISLAVGMAIARDHLKQDHKVVAVIGDGGLTGGMALEAINHLGHIQRNVVIVLNDNEMSISENLGGFSQYMRRIKETFFYKDIKEKLDVIENNLDSIPLQPQLWDLISSVKQQAKQRLDTPGIVFEKLGINYTGPVDGHDVGALIAALNKVKDCEAPQIVHVITQKGKGYAPAEADAIKYHGVSAVKHEKVEPAEPAKPKAKTYSQVFTDALIELAEIEPNLVAITPATAEGSGLVNFGKIYPERFFDVAICEQHAVTMAAALAKSGLLPVVSIYSTFLQRAMDQVIHDVAILNLPVIFGIDRGGLVEDGETHQGVFDIAYLRSVPNLTVLAPKDARELRNMLYTAVKERKGPVAVRFPRDNAVNAETYPPFAQIKPAQWETLHQGEDAVILAYGAMVDAAEKAIPLLASQGMQVGLVNARSAKPVDSELLAHLIANAKRPVITIEEGCLAGGFGAAVLEWAAAHRLVPSHPSGSNGREPSVGSGGRKPAEQSPIFCLGVPDHFVEHGARKILLDINGLSPEKIAEFIRSIVRQ